MGYVHDVAMSNWVFPNEFMHSAGTWTQKESSAADCWCVERTANHSDWNTFIPIKAPQNSVAGKGAKLVSIDVWYKILTEALNSVTATLYKVTKQIDGAALVAGAEVTCTYDTGHDTAAERYDVDEHVMTLTLSTPEWMDHEDLYFLELACSAEANGVFEELGARVNYTLRV
jgi:hypothetical protein